jgi:hypothetical protein
VLQASPGAFPAEAVGALDQLHASPAQSPVTEAYQRAQIEDIMYLWALAESYCADPGLRREMRCVRATRRTREGVSYVCQQLCAVCLPRPAFRERAASTSLFRISGGRSPVVSVAHSTVGHAFRPYLRSSLLGREEDGLLSEGVDGRRLQSHVQLLNGREGCYMIGSVEFTEPHAASSQRQALGITWGGTPSDSAG